MKLMFFSFEWRILFHLFILLSLFPLHQFFQTAAWKGQIVAKEATSKSVADALQAFLRSYQNTNSILWLGRNKKKGGVQKRPRQKGACSKTTK